MKKKVFEYFHSVSLRLPQRIALRVGMRITTYGTQSNSLFWSIFTSREYNSFVPYLLRLKVAPATCIDCGSALGYFSLLIEFLRRAGILPWTLMRYILVEPMPHNFKRLKFNISGNLNNYIIHPNAVGKKDGKVSFFFNKLVPWGGSIFKKGRLVKRLSVKYYDLSETLASSPCLLKLDIEGAEYDFFDTYGNQLSSVVAIIVEWHTEYGDRGKVVDLLSSRGFIGVHQSLNKNNRIVELIVNKNYYN